MREIKGEVSFPQVIAVIIAVVVLSLVAFGSVSKFDWFQRIFSLGLPDYNRSVDVNPGMAIVGIKLNHLQNPATEGTPKAISYFILGQRNLSYYTGSEWVEVKQSDLTIETKQLNAVAMRNALAEFYFNTPRIGSGVFALPNYRQLSPYVPTCCGLFEQHGNVIFYNETRPGYAGAPLTSAYLGFDNKFYKTELYPKFNEIKDYDSLKPQIVSWRDQILQGEPCQKTISLSYNDAGSPVTRTYFVQKIPREDGMYVYVDLNVPASARELYREHCFPLDGAIATKHVNTASIYLNFSSTAYDRIGAYWMPSSPAGYGKWYVLSRSDYLLSEISGKKYYRYLQHVVAGDFYQGLTNILSFSEAKNLHEIRVIPHLVPDFSTEVYSPKIIYGPTSIVQSIGGFYKPEAVRTLAISLYNQQARTFSHYYANPLGLGRTGESYYLFSFESTDLPVYVGYSLNHKSYALYAAPRDVRTYTEIIDPEQESTLTFIGTLNPLSTSVYNSMSVPSPNNQDYQISIDNDELFRVSYLNPETRSILQGLNGLSLGSMIPDTYNNYIAP